VTTLRAAVLARLAGDATLAALATGGIYDAEALGRPGLELADVTAGTPVVQPCVFVRWTTEDPFGAAAINAVRTFAEIYVYQDTGYATCQALRERVWALLHQQRVAIDEPAGWRCAAIIWAGDVTESVDESLGGASMERSRYEVHLTRGRTT